MLVSLLFAPFDAAIQHYRRNATRLDMCGAGIDDYLGRFKSDARRRLKREMSHAALRPYLSLFSRLNRGHVAGEPHRPRVDAAP